MLRITSNKEKNKKSTETRKYIVACKSDEPNRKYNKENYVNCRHRKSLPAVYAFS